MKNYYLLIVTLFFSFLLFSCNKSDDITFEQNKERLLNLSSVRDKYQELNDSIRSLYTPITKDKELDKKIDAMKIALADARGVYKGIKITKTIPGTASSKLVTAAISGTLFGTIQSLRAYIAQKADSAIRATLTSSNVYDFYNIVKYDNIKYLEILPSRYDYIDVVAGLHNAIIDKALNPFVQSPYNSIDMEPVDINSYNNNMVAIFNDKDFDEQVVYVTNNDNFIYECDNNMFETDAIYSNQTIYNDFELLLDRLKFEEKSQSEIIFNYFIRAMSSCRNINEARICSNVYSNRVIGESFITESEKENLLLSISVSLNSYSYWIETLLNESDY